MEPVSNEATQPAPNQEVSLQARGWNGDQLQVLDTLADQGTGRDHGNSTELGADGVRQSQESPVADMRYESVQIHQSDICIHVRYRIHLYVPQETRFLNHLRY